MAQQVVQGAQGTGEGHRERGRVLCGCVNVVGRCCGSASLCPPHPAQPCRPALITLDQLRWRRLQVVEQTCCAACLPGVRVQEEQQKKCSMEDLQVGVTGAQDSACAGLAA